MKRARGFTLIELMLVVALIGILSAIAVPKLLYFVQKSQCSTTKGNLATLRSAISIYYSEQEGRYPLDNLSCLVAGKYLQSIPNIILPAVPGLNRGHPTNNTVTTPVPFFFLSPDPGTWGYCNDPNGHLSVVVMMVIPWGHVLVNCLHRDEKGWWWFAS